MGGFFAGLLVGAVVVVGAAAGAALLVPLNPRPEVTSDAPQASDIDDGAVQADVTKPGPEADLVELAPRAPDEPAAATELTKPTTGADVEPGSRPEIADTTDAPTGPRTGDAPVVGSSADRPVAQSAAVAPLAPTQDDSPVISTDSTSPGSADSGAPITGEAPLDEDVVTSDARETPPSLVDSTIVPVAPLTPQEPETVTEGEDSRIAALPRLGEESGEATGPRIGTPVVPLTERNRPEATHSAVGKDAIPPIEAFASAFENPGDKPLMSIILIDDATSLGVEALQEFPYPLTFAIDPTEPGAAEKIARHREAGFEVVMLANLPKAATAQDAEVSMAVWLDEMPEIVAIMEGTGSGIQGNRTLSDQVTAIADDTGRGLITQDNGLNTVQKLAARDGVPAAVVFRDFDGAGQSPTVMRRFLDQAAFRAGQEGAVVMLGRVRPDTISALLLWGLQDRADRVALSPVSAVLTQNVN